MSCLGERQFQLDTTTGSPCYDSGNGNGQLNPSNATADFNHETWTLLDSSANLTAGTDPFKNTLDINETGQFFGDFRIGATVWGTYSRVILALQAKVANVNPDWAAFELADGVITGSWSIEGSSLGHANLYGIVRDDGTTGTTATAAAVPEPTSLALLGAGLAFGARRLRRKK